MNDPYLLLYFVTTLPHMKGCILHTKLLMCNKNYSLFWTKNQEYLKKLFRTVENDGYSTMHFLCGVLHSIGDLPAIEHVDGTKQWYKWGRLHRSLGPAIELFIGIKKWYLHGKLHRQVGPAIEFPLGIKEWYLHGKRHRDDGPAIEFPNGHKEWYNNGKEYTPPPLKSFN